MNRSKLIVAVSAVLLLLLLFFLFRAHQGDRGKTTILTISNSLSDITLTEAYLGEDTSNILDHQLRPSTSAEITVYGSHQIIRAVDTDGGVYTSECLTNDSTAEKEIEISMSCRSVFEETIESGGEYWSGSGSSTIRITNSVLERDLYWIYISQAGAEEMNTREMLGAFILYPGRTLNVRIEPGAYTIVARDGLNDEYRLEPIEIIADRSSVNWNPTRDDRYHPPEISGNGNSSITICNALDDWIITGVHHRLSTESSWSENHIATSSIEPKEEFTLLLDPGVYDVRVVDEDNDTYTLYESQIPFEGTSWDVTMSDLDQFSRQL